jgi:hypothetical protein
MTLSTRYSDVLRIKERRESAAETRLLQARRKLQEAFAEESSANDQLQDWTNKCQVRERELYDKLLSGGAVKLSEIDKVKFEVEGMRSDLKRREDEVRAAERRREEAEQVRDEARKAYQTAARSREKTSLVVSAQQEEKAQSQNRQAEEDIEEFSEQGAGRRRGDDTEPMPGDAF